MSWFDGGTVSETGLSPGGDTALVFAIAHPQRVSALVLLCPGISGYPWPDDSEVNAEFERAEAEGVEGIAAVGLRLWAAAGPTPEVTDQLRSAARAWLSNEEFEQPNPPVFDRLGEIAVPTALLIGDLDRPPLIERNLRAAERIPGCALIQVSGVDHLPPLRIPDRVLQTITETLARVQVGP